MAGHGRRKLKNRMHLRWIMVCIALVMLLFFAGVHVLEERMAVKIENAGMQMTSHINNRSTAQVFMNGRWYAERNVETLLIIGVDEYGKLKTSEDYNNDHQTDFLFLLLRDEDTGRIAAIHLNRDTMTNITTLGVTGEPTGMRWAQLALAYNYGDGSAQSSNNVVSSVEHLLYGIEIDHYITVTMDAVPILNDWVGGVILEIQDDFTEFDEELVQGELLKLNGQQALAYVRTRKGLDDSSNLHRMERQRQYAAEWLKSAQDEMNDTQAVVDLALKLDGYYDSSCTVEQFTDLARNMTQNPSLQVLEIEGDAVQGDVYMEFHVDENALQQLVLDLFYAPVI